MAQKKKKEPQKTHEKKEEKFEWTPPDFDENEFLIKDMKGTRVLLVTALFSIIAGIVAFFLTDASWYLGIVVIIGLIVSLRYVYPLFKINVKDIEKKAWAGNIAMFFLLSLGLWVVLLNPPFSDHTDPSIEPTMWVQNNQDNWTVVSNVNTEIHFGQNISFNANVTDIGSVESVEISIYKTGDTGTFVSMERVSDGVYGYKTTYTSDGNSSAVYNYIIMATDKYGNTDQTNPSQFVVNQ